MQRPHKLGYANKKTKGRVMKQSKKDQNII